MSTLTMCFSSHLIKQKIKEESHNARSFKILFQQTFYTCGVARDSTAFLADKQMVWEPGKLLKAMGRLAFPPSCNQHYQQP